jgi:hypothetical protein
MKARLLRKIKTPMVQEALWILRIPESDTFSKHLRNRQGRTRELCRTNEGPVPHNSEFGGKAAAPCSLLCSQSIRSRHEARELRERRRSHTTQQKLSGVSDSHQKMRYVRSELHALFSEAKCSAQARN